MKISDKLNCARPTLSFELFPPKVGMAIEPTYEVVHEIAKLNPDFMSVTYGAGGGNSKNTVAIADEMQNRCGITALAHMTCVMSDRKGIKERLDTLYSLGIENILALRGDIPKDFDGEPFSDYKYACDLVSDIKSDGRFCIGAACYPEGHIECDHRELDIDHLKNKVDCGVDFLTTQMFFDNTVLYSFLYRAMAKGIDVPVIAGIMPVTNGKQIARSCALSGATLPNRFCRIVDKFGDDPQSMKQAGIAYATEQIIDLVANGIRGIHVYTMNKPDIAKAICDNLSHIIGNGVAVE